MRLDKYIVSVDFDGTLVEHQFPFIGPPIPGAFETLKKFRRLGAVLVLWTCRSGDTLDQAVEYCRNKGIEFDAINDNAPTTRFRPKPKIVASIYIDDAANNILRRNPENMIEVWENLNRELDIIENME